MDQVVRHTWMIGLRRKHRLEDRRGLSLVVIRLVSRGSRRHQRQRIENRRFVILGIPLMHTAHRLSVSVGSRSVAALLPTVIENAQSFNVILLSRCSRLQFPRL